MLNIDTDMTWYGKLNLWQFRSKIWLLWRLRFGCYIFHNIIEFVIKALWSLFDDYSRFMLEDRYCFVFQIIIVKIIQSWHIYRNMTITKFDKTYSYEAFCNFVKTYLSLYVVSSEFCHLLFLLILSMTIV